MARGYNSARGRFLQPDPISSKNAPQGQPQGLNRYSYVQNDPVNATDPTGEFLSYCGWGIWEQIVYGFASSGICGGGWTNYKEQFAKQVGRGGGGGGGESQRRPPSLKLTVMAAPKASTKCGEAFAQYEFSIENGAVGVNGWVIQHLIRSVEVVDKNGNRIAPINGARSIEYWEAWEVKNGYVYSPGYGPIGIDRWQTSDQGLGTAGTWDVIGFAKFVPTGSGIDPTSWSDPATEAGVLRSTLTRPAGWSDYGGVHNDMEVIWDCTTTPPANPIVR